MRGRATRVLDASAIAAIVSATGVDRMYELAVERLTAVLTEHAAGTVDLRERDGFVLESPHQGLLEWMPAVRHGSSVSLKAVGYNPHNPAKYALPTILSSISLFDAATGHLRTVMDGTFATALRTGSASAIATRLLASPDARVLGLVGCGAQAVTQLHALARTIDVREVLVSDIDPEAERSFARRARDAGRLVRVASLEEVEERADVLCTATSVGVGEGPVIDGGRLKPGIHINCVGSDMPGKYELPLSTLRGSVVCPDHPAQAMREGECRQLAAEEIGPSLSDLLLAPERAKPLRSVPTVYDSTGLALQDLAMAELFSELSQTLGVGDDVTIESSAGDPRDPYAFLETAA